MMRKIAHPIMILTGLLTASCSGQGLDSAPAPLTEKQAAILTKALDGKVAGKPVDCVTANAATNFTRVSDDILLYRTGGKTVYQNTLPNRCFGLGNDDDILVFKRYGSGYCKGDLIRRVDRFSGIQDSTCQFGAFIPYKKIEG
jgi:hypothetical protein